MLANLLKVDVMASVESVWVDNRGKMIVSDKKPSELSDYELSDSYQ